MARKNTYLSCFIKINKSVFSKVNGIVINGKNYFPGNTFSWIRKYLLLPKSMRNGFYLWFYILIILFILIFYNTKSVTLSYFEILRIQVAITHKAPIFIPMEHSIAINKCNSITDLSICKHKFFYRIMTRSWPTNFLYHSILFTFLCYRIPPMNDRSAESIRKTNIPRCFMPVFIIVSRPKFIEDFYQTSFKRISIYNISKF